MKIVNYKFLTLACLLLFLGNGCNTAKVSDTKKTSVSTKTGEGVASKPEPPPVFVAPSGKTPQDKPTGSVKTNQPSPAPSSLPQPNNCGNNFDCYEQYYQGLVKNYGVAQAFVELKQQAQTSSYIEAQCHPITHVIGRAATELYPKVSEAYLHGDSYCWSGYYHGVMEGIVGKVGRANFPNMVNQICADIPGKDKYTFDYFNCVHGMGHGVMVFTNDELFDALKMCGQLTGYWEQNSCYGGAFMENVIVDNKNHFTKFLKKDDLLYPCNAVDAPYKQQCYLMQTSYMLKENGGDFKQGFALCEKADAGFVPTCDQSLGRDASSRSNYLNAGMIATCKLGSTLDQQSNCIIGAVKDVISNFHSDIQAKQLCAALDGDLQKTCSETAVSYYKSF